MALEALEAGSMLLFRRGAAQHISSLPPLQRVQGWCTLLLRAAVAIMLVFRTLSAAPQNC